MNRSRPANADDLVEALIDLALRHAEDGTVQVDVLATRQLGVEAGAELEQRGDLALGGDRAAVGTQDPRHALEQRALARTVLADQPERGAFGDLEAHAFQRVELLVAGASAAEEHRLDGLVALVIEAELLPDVVDADRGLHVRLPRRGVGRGGRTPTFRAAGARPTTRSGRGSRSGGKRRLYIASR